MPHDVFISYAHQDRPVAEAVCAALESRGVRCWMAPRDITAGNYAAAIVRAIKASRGLVLILSSNANRSRHVAREVELAAKNDAVTIYPLQIEKVAPSEALEFFVSSEHCLEAWEQPLEKHLERLTDGVLRVLHGAGETPAPADVSAQPRKGYEYHAFLSCSAKDYAWAEEIQRLLYQTRRIKCFLYTDAPPNDRWDPKMVDALKESQNLIVVWSDSARESERVDREMGWFEAVAEPYREMAHGTARKIIFVILEGQVEMWGMYQHVDTIRKFGSYDRGVVALERNVQIMLTERLIVALSR